MPRYKIETSLFDPLVIELGDKVFTSVPRSVRLTEEVKALDERRSAGELDIYSFLLQFLGLFFHVNPEEFRDLDRAILEAIGDRALDYVNPPQSKKLETMTVDKALADAPTPEVPAVPVNEALAEKNAPKPGSEPTP